MVNELGEYTDENTTERTTSTTISEEFSKTINDNIESNEPNRPRGRGRPKGSRNKTNREYGTTDGNTIEPIQPDIKDEEFTEDQKADKVTKKAIDKPHRSRKQTDKAISQLLKMVFETENKLLTQIDPTLEISKDSIELLGNTGSELFPTMVQDMSDQKFCGLVFAGAVVMTHAPIVLKLVQHQIEKNKHKKYNKMQIKKGYDHLIVESEPIAQTTQL